MKAPVRVHPVAVVVLVVGALVVGAAAVAAESAHRDTEQRLLDQRTAEAGAILSVAITGLETPLSSAAELAEVTNGDPAAFRAVLGRLTGDGKQFVSTSLYPVGGTEPVVSIGAPTVLQQAGATRVQAMLAQATVAPRLAVVDLLDLPARHMGYAFTSFQAPAHYVVYAETALPPRTSRSRTTGPFEDLAYATYLGPEPVDRELLYASVERVPLRGRTSQSAVDFGDHKLLLVTTTSAVLSGELSRDLPLLIALIGAVIVVLAAVVVNRTLRRRRAAELLASDVSSRYEDERHRAETLQRSLLPRDLPHPPGVQVAARYWPADQTSEIGGDFYDLFEVGEGRWAVTIGDVCGKGIEAAALTGVTRHTIRAAARHVESPTDVLLWAYEAIVASSADTYATACFAFLTLDGDGARLDVALGGHPRPLRWRPDGRIEPLGESGTVLGLVAPQLTRLQYTVEPGDIVVFFTDGVTDAPRDLGLSMDELEQALRDSAATGPDGIVDTIRREVERRRPGGSDDDTAILVLQFGMTPAPIVEPDPAGAVGAGGA